MTDGDALLRTIIVDPADDTPRLVYADWLEENGEPDRAEFIRVQVKLARLGDNPECSRGTPNADDCGDPRCPRRRHSRLRRRERELWAKAADDAMQADEPLWGVLPTWHVAGWSPNELHVVRLRDEGHPEFRLRFRRGFVSAVTCTAEDWVEHGDALVGCQPVERVALTTWPSRDPGWSEYLWRDGGDLAVFRVCGREVLVRAGRGAGSLLEARWPGVAFRLPPPPLCGD